MRYRRETRGCPVQVRRLLRMLQISVATVLILFCVAGRGVGSAVGWIEHPVNTGDAGAPFLFVIEENHASLAVQRNVQGILEMLSSSLGTRTVLVEGTYPSDEDETPLPLDLSLVSGSGAGRYRAAVESAWFEFGLLSGVEMAALSAGGEGFSIYGVEDRVARILFSWSSDFAADEEDNLLTLLDDLLTGMAGHPATVLELMGRPLVPDYVSAFPELLDATLRLRSTLEAVPRGRAATFEQVLSAIATEVERGKSLPDAAGTVGESLEFDADSPTAAALFHGAVSAREQLYASIIDTAERSGLDSGSASQALDWWRLAQQGFDEALNERHPAMIENALAALDAAGVRAGILVVGAGHTEGLEVELRERGLSFLVVTPDGMGPQDASRQEADWFYRNLQLESDDEYTPIATWLLGYKPGLVTADPRHRDALAFSVSLAQALDSVMTGGPTVPEALGTGGVAADVRIVDAATDGYSAMTISGPNGKTLRVEVPNRGPRATLGLSPEDAHQLTLFMLETLASDTQSVDSDSLRPHEEAAIRLYDEGNGVTALLAVRTSETEQTIRLIYPTKPDLRAGDLAEEYDYVFGSVSEFRRAAGDPSVIARNREFLNELMRHLETFADSLNLGYSPAFPVALQFDPSANPIRDVNFSLVHTLLKSLGAIAQPDRNILFVNSASQEDRPDETSLGKTLHNMHAYAGTERRIAIITVPSVSCSLSEWKAHPYAQELTAKWNLSQSKAWAWYKQQYGPRVSELVASVGIGNTCFPRNAGEMLKQVSELLADSPSASITITLMAHTSASGTLELAFPDGMSALDDALWTLRQLQDGGGLPSGPDVEFDMLACDFGTESAATVLGMLGARLVLASPHSVSFYGASYFDSYLTAERQSGVPLHEAYLRALKALVEDVAGLGLEEECTDLLWVPQLYSVDVRKGESVTG